MRASILLLASLFVGCGSSSEASAPADASDAGAETPVDTGAEEAPPADAGPAVPTDKDVQFEAVNPLPSGEQIVFNDWNSTPNAVRSMRPDGTGETTIFKVFRVWSMGVSHKGDAIAFSCGDPQQEKNWGLTFGDSIQHTWMYDVTTQKIALVAHGNLNDECHTFSSDDKRLYVCRRYDFAEADGTSTNKGWRIARIDLATRTPTFLTPEVKGQFALGPQPTADEKELWYSMITIAGGTQKLRVVKQALPDGAPVDVKADAGKAVLSPDGTRFAYSAANSTEKGALHVANLDGTGDVVVSKAAGTNVAWSPDGKKLVYTLFESSGSCDHLDVVATDGSQADAPTRIRDCLKTKDFVTKVAWIKR